MIACPCKFEHSLYVTDGLQFSLSRSEVQPRVDLLNTRGHHVERVPILSHRHDDSSDDSDDDKDVPIYHQRAPMHVHGMYDQQFNKQRDKP